MAEESLSKFLQASRALDKVWFVRKLSTRWKKRVQADAARAATACGVVRSYDTEAAETLLADAKHTLNKISRLQEHKQFSTWLSLRQAECKLFASARALLLSFSPSCSQEISSSAQAEETEAKELKTECGREAGAASEQSVLTADPMVDIHVDARPNQEQQFLHLHSLRESETSEDADELDNSDNSTYTVSQLDASEGMQSSNPAPRAFSQTFSERLVSEDASDFASGTDSRATLQKNVSDEEAFQDRPGETEHVHDNSGTQWAHDTSKAFYACTEGKTFAGADENATTKERSLPSQHAQSKQKLRRQSATANTVYNSTGGIDTSSATAAHFPELERSASPEETQEAPRLYETHDEELSSHNAASLYHKSCVESNGRDRCHDQGNSHLQRAAGTGSRSTGFHLSMLNSADSYASYEADSSHIAVHESDLDLQHRQHGGEPQDKKYAMHQASTEQCKSDETGAKSQGASIDYLVDTCFMLMRYPSFMDENDYHRYMSDRDVAAELDHLCQGKKTDSVQQLQKIAHSTDNIGKRQLALAALAAVYEAGIGGVSPNMYKAEKCKQVATGSIPS